MLLRRQKEDDIHRPAIVVRKEIIPRTEQAVSGEQLSRLVATLRQRFIQRTDLHARQKQDGSYVCIHRPLTDRHIAAHLLGSDTLGAYVLDAAGQASFAVLDADDDHGWSSLLSLAKQLQEQGIPVYCESSRRGGHLWFFFHEPLSAKQARQFGLGLLQRHGLPDMEVFPKQTRLGKGPGSLVRLPFGVHRKSGKRYGFITPEQTPLAPSLHEQIEILTKPLLVPVGAIDAYARRAPHAPRRAPKVRDEMTDMTLSDRIKASVSLVEFIGQYVELSSSGTGHCPFHGDEVASFSVNEKDGYWYCFGCGRGGSIIDFWMHYRHCGFKQALRELCDVLHL